MKKIQILLFVFTLSFLGCQDATKNESVFPNAKIGEQNIEKELSENTKKLIKDLNKKGYNVEVNPIKGENNELPDFHSSNGILQFLELTKSEKDERKVHDFLKKELKNYDKILFKKIKTKILNSKNAKDNLVNIKVAFPTCANLNRFYSITAPFTATGGINFGINTNSGHNASLSTWGLVGFNPFSWFDKQNTEISTTSWGAINISVRGYRHFGVQYEGNILSISTTVSYKIHIGCDGSIHIDEIIA